MAAIKKVLAVCLVTLFLLSFLSNLVRPLHGCRGISRCQSNLSNLGKCLALYRMHHKGRAPESFGSAFWLSFRDTTPPLIDDRNVDLLFCPRRDDDPVPGATHYRGPAVRVGFLSPEDPLGADLVGNHGRGEGGNVLLLDGSVEEVPADSPRWSLCSSRLLP